jgi:hypothetical protein
MENKDDVYGLIYDHITKKEEPRDGFIREMKKAMSDPNEGNQFIKAISLMNKYKRKSGDNNGTK